MPNKLDTKVYSSINAIDIVLTFAIPQARLSPKSVSGSDKKCKEIKIQVKRLKKIWKKEEI